ncbi:MAG: GNAT family N-acetyltransferase [Chloroflexota bacterium]|nr:GNAT family N-acetyltransferase [Chloroflexota bacterium]
MRVCQAEAGDIDYIVDLSRRVQEKLTALGSLQKIGPIARAMVAAHVSAGSAHILEAAARRLGSVFVAPTTPASSPRLARWGLSDPHLAYWFLEKLMIEPAKQGHGLGYTLLDGIRAYVASHKQPSCIVLDCWAGNDTLRAFYTRAGFALQGVFRATGGFEIAVFTYRQE